MKTKKKVLFIANNKGFSNFNAPYMHWFKIQGWIVDNASPGIESGEVDHQFDVDIHRSPLSPKNFSAYRQLKKIINSGDYDIIHVHTPMGAALGRLAAISARKRGTKVIYTAHGFHFYKGAPLKNWLIFYPIEKILAGITDSLVTINAEDYQTAQTKKLAKGPISHIDGVGVNLDRFHPVSDEERSRIRESLGLKKDDFVGLYTAQVIPRKNHELIIRAIPDIIKTTPNFRMLFAGSGESMDKCVCLAQELGVANKVNFLGARSDVPQLCAIADVHISSSIQEGQGIGNIEAMAAGCTLIVTDIRGHRDVCIDGRNGFLFALDDTKKLVHSIHTLAHDKELLKRISKTNIEDAKKYSIVREVERMAEIYRHLMDSDNPIR